MFPFIIYILLLILGQPYLKECGFRCSCRVSILLGPNWEFSFSLLLKNIILTIFLGKKKKEKKILLPPDWQPVGQETVFFKGGLICSTIVHTCIFGNRKRETQKIW